MKSKFTIVTLLSVLLSFATIGQVTDHSYTDCDGNTESIYGIIATGKPLLIASKGFDCSICMSQAGKVQNFASLHPEVRVWGAMNYKYSSSIPECPALVNWRTTYSWNDIFMFNDVNDQWQGVSYPTYYVINPLDSTIAYQGPNFNTAEATALSLVPTGLKPVDQNPFSISFMNNMLELTCSPTNCEGAKVLSIISLSGQVAFLTEIQVQTDEKSIIPLTQVLAPGIYLARISDKHGLSYSAKLIIR